MRNQIIATFLLLGLISSIMLLRQDKELKGAEENINKEESINLNKINVFKWTINKNYRRSYLKRINERI